MPHALLINPPVYDFALYDLFHKPLGLMHIGRWLEEAGFGVEIVDALDVNDEPSQAILGMPRRLSNGTGHFFKQAVKFPMGHFLCHNRIGKVAFFECFIDLPIQFLPIRNDKDGGIF